MDSFLSTYQSADFEVLVAAEVLHRKAAAKFQQRSAPYPAASPKSEQAPPWRQPQAMPAPPGQSMPAPAVASSPVRPMAPSAAAFSPAVSSSPVSPTAGQVATEKAAPAVPIPLAASRAAASSSPMASGTAASSGGSEPSSKPKPETEVEYLRRRLHNTQRAGRNRLYYQMLNLHGPVVAAKYWVDAPHRPPPKAQPKAANP